MIFLLYMVPILVNAFLLCLQIAKRLEPIPKSEENSATVTVLPGEKPMTNCTIFLGLTSNMISSGVRETVRYLVEHNMVSSGTYLLVFRTCKLHDQCIQFNCILNAEYIV